MARGSRAPDGRHLTAAPSLVCLRWAPAQVTAFFLELDISDVGATAPPSAQPFLEGCGFKESYRGCHTLTLGDSAAGQLLLTSGGGAGNTPLRRELVLSPSPELVLSPSPSLATAPAPMVDEKYAAVVRG